MTHRPGTVRRARGSTRPRQDGDDHIKIGYEAAGTGAGQTVRATEPGAGGGSAPHAVLHRLPQARVETDLDWCVASTTENPPPPKARCRTSSQMAISTVKVAPGTQGMRTQAAASPHVARCRCAAVVGRPDLRCLQRLPGTPAFRAAMRYVETPRLMPTGSASSANLLLAAEPVIAGARVACALLARLTLNAERGRPALATARSAADLRGCPLSRRARGRGSELADLRAQVAVSEKLP